MFWKSYLIFKFPRESSKLKSLQVQNQDIGRFGYFELLGGYHRSFTSENKVSEQLLLNFSSSLLYCPFVFQRYDVFECLSLDSHEIR